MKRLIGLTLVIVSFPTLIWGLKIVVQTDYTSGVLMMASGVFMGLGGAEWIQGLDRVQSEGIDGD